MDYLKPTSPLAWIIIFFVALFAYTKIVGPIPFDITSVMTTKSTTFDVSGEGKSILKPDTASVSVGVRAEASTVKEAQNKINETINEVSTSLKTLGISSDDIKTTNYSINPDYDYTTSVQRIKGYHAATTLSVKVKNIDLVNQVIDASTANGANEVYGVSFDVDDKTKAQNEAREKAVADAKNKAEQAAKIAGFRLGRIVNYNENMGGLVGPIYRATAQVMELSVQDSAPTQVEPGSNEISVTVVLSYEIQ